MWTAADAVYRIPGAKRWAASQPSPKAGDTHARLDAELLFLGAFRSVGHVVLFGLSETAMTELATLHHEANVARPGPLAPHTRYYWRVVAQMPDGTERPGRTFRFTTGSRKACVARPLDGNNLQHKPTPPSCLAALGACCGPAASGTHGGNVKGLGDQCMGHMKRHNASLSDPEAGCDLQDEQRFCDPCDIGLPFCDPTCRGMAMRDGVVPKGPGCCWPAAQDKPPCCKDDPIPPNCCVK